jgi:hypothetical protein
MMFQWQSLPGSVKKNEFGVGLLEISKEKD